MYGERLTAAAAYIKGIDPKSDPQIYGILTTLARASSSPRPALDAIYAAVTKEYPRWFISYGNRADILQQKWFGQPGELASYTQSLLLSSPGGEDGEIAYSYLAQRLVGQYKRDEIFEATGLTWPLVKEAYAVREKRYGMNNSNWNVLLEMAVSARDITYAKTALRHIGNDWDASVWKQKQYFDSVVAWANAK
jgi:hypothetical protein